MKTMQINKKQVIAFINRYHLVIFTVLTALTLCIAVLLLNGVASKASGEGIIPQSGTSLNFDQATIDKIESLKTSDEPSEPLDLSQGRINPFGE